MFFFTTQKYHWKGNPEVDRSEAGQNRVFSGSPTKRAERTNEKVLSSCSYLLLYLLFSSTISLSQKCLPLWYSATSVLSDNIAVQTAGWNGTCRWEKNIQSQTEAGARMFLFRASKQKNLKKPKQTMTTKKPPPSLALLCYVHSHGNICSVLRVIL